MDVTNRPRTPIFLAALAGMVVVLALGVLALAQATKPPRSGLERATA